MPLNDPKGYLTKVPKGTPATDIHSINNTRSSPTIAKLHIDEDLEHIRRLGPGPLPWERRNTEATLPANTPTVPPPPDVY